MIGRLIDLALVGNTMLVHTKYTREPSHDKNINTPWKQYGDCH